MSKVGGKRGVAGPRQPGSKAPAPPPSEPPRAEAPTAGLFPADRRAPATSPKTTASWIAVQSAPSSAPATRGSARGEASPSARPAASAEAPPAGPPPELIERHLKVILKKGGYADERTLEWRSTPEDVRRHPTYVRRMLAEDHRYASWVKGDADEAAIRAVLADPEVAAGLGGQLAHCVRLVPEATAADPRVRPLLAAAVRGSAERYSQLPEGARRAPELVEALLSHDLKEASRLGALLEPSDPGFGDVTAKISARVRGGGALGKVPEPVRRAPGFLAEVLAARPLLWLELTPAERATHAALFEDPALAERAAPEFAKWFVDNYGDRGRARWELAPPALRTHPVYLSKTWCEAPGAAAWSGASAEALTRLLVDPETREPFYGWWLMRHGDVVPPAAFAVPELRARVLAALPKEASSYGKLPEAVRGAKDLVEVACASSPAAVAAALPRGVEPELVRWVGEQLIASIGPERATSWAGLPARMREEPSFVALALEAWPWLEVPEALSARQAEVLADPAHLARAVERHVKTLGSLWSPEERDALRRRLPEVVRLHPAFVRGALRAGPEIYRAPKSAEEQAAYAAALADPEFLAEAKFTLYKLMSSVPETTLLDPRVVAAAAAHLSSQYTNFAEYVAPLRSHPTVIAAALVASPKNVRLVPLPERGDPLRAPVAEAWAKLASPEVWPEIPAELRAEPAFLVAAVVNSPALWKLLTPEERAEAEPALDDPKFYERARGAMLEIAATLPEARLSDARVVALARENVKHSPWSASKLPKALLQEPTVVAALLEAEPRAAKVIPWDGLSAESKESLRRTADRTVERGYLEDVHPTLRGSAEFLSAAVRKSPSVLHRLNPAELALVAPVLADPAFPRAADLSVASATRFLSAEALAHPDVVDWLIAQVLARPGDYDALPPALKLDPRAVLAVLKKKSGGAIPKEAFTAELVLRLAKEEPELLSPVPRDAISPEAVEAAESVLIGRMSESSRLGALPEKFRASLRLRRALLQTAGPKAFDEWNTRKLLAEPELWTDAPVEAMKEALEKGWVPFSVLAERAREAPELILTALGRTQSATERAPILAAIDPKLWARASFVDGAMAIDPTLFALASPKLRAVPERARRAIHAHPANLDHARVEPATLREILASVPLRRPAMNRGPWDEEALIRYNSSHSTAADVDLRHAPLIGPYLAEHPEHAVHLTPAQLADPELLIRLATTHPAALREWPLDSLTADEKTTVLAALEAALDRAPALFPNLPAALRNERRLLEAVVDRFPAAMLHTKVQDADLWRRALEQDVKLFPKCPIQDRAMLEHATQATAEQLAAKRLGPRQIPKPLYEASDDVVKAAIKAYGGEAIGWFAGWLSRPEVRSTAEAVILGAPERAARGLEKLPAELASRLAALPRDADGGPNRAGLRFAIALADRAPRAVSALPPELANHPSVRAIAWSLDPPAGAIRSVHTVAERVAIVEKNPGALAELPPELRSREVVLAAVTIEGRHLELASAALRDDPEIVRAAVASDGAALQHASDRLRADPDLVETAIRRDPAAFAHSKVKGPAARRVEVVAIREGGVIDSRLERLVDKDAVLAFAAHTAEFTYDGKVTLSDHLYRFEHHLDDPEFAAKLLELRPGLLRDLPEKYWTPENLFVAARRGALWSSNPPDPRLDVTKLPPDRWAALASAQPESFLVTFTAKRVAPEALGALRAATLAAIARDAALTSTVDSTWWADAEFVAGMVSSNPLVWESFGPARRRWLAELAPEVAAAADGFLADLAKAGLTMKRFAKRTSLLREIVQNRNSDAEDPRPVAVVVYPKWDHNGAFDWVEFERLTERYRVMYYEAGSVSELIDALRDGTRRGPASVVVLAGHGSPESIELGKREDHPDGGSHLRTETLTELAERVPSERLVPGAKVVFHACSVGGGGKWKRNLVNSLAEVWPHVSIQAAWFPSSGANGFVFTDDGLFDRMDFRDAKTRRPVPSHFASPRPNPESASTR